MTRKGVFLALLSSVTLAIVVFFASGAYDLFGPDVAGSVVDQPAKYEGGKFYTDAQGKSEAELRFITMSGDTVAVKGNIAKDMVDHDVTFAGSGFVRLSYDTLTQYTRSGKVISKFCRVKSWKPVSYGEPMGWKFPE